jgi:hypothetical protein
MPVSCFCVPSRETRVHECSAVWCGTVQSYITETSIHFQASPAEPYLQNRTRSSMDMVGTRARPSQYVRPIPQDGPMDRTCVTPPARDGSICRYIPTTRPPSVVSSLVYCFSIVLPSSHTPYSPSCLQLLESNGTRKEDKAA